MRPGVSRPGPPERGILLDALKLKHYLALTPILFAAFAAHVLIGAPAYGAASNPHWKAGTCNVCHDSEAPTADNLALKTTPGYAVCADCHDGGDAHVCRHRSDIALSDERSADVDDIFKSGLVDGQVGRWALKWKRHVCMWAGTQVCAPIDQEVGRWVGGWVDRRGGREVERE